MPPTATGNAVGWCIFPDAQGSPSTPRTLALALLHPDRAFLDRHLIGAPTPCVPVEPLHRGIESAALSLSLWNWSYSPAHEVNDRRRFSNAFARTFVNRPGWWPPGCFDGVQIVPPAWIEAALTILRPAAARQALIILSSEENYQNAFGEHRFGTWRQRGIHIPGAATISTQPM